MVRGLEHRRTGWGSCVGSARTGVEYNCYFQLPDGGYKRWRQTLLVACKGQGAHFATGGSPSRYKGKKKKKCSQQGSQALEKAAQSCGVSILRHAQGLAQPIWLPGKPCFEQRTGLRPPEILANLDHLTILCGTQKMRAQLCAWMSF